MRVGEFQHTGHRGSVLGEVSVFEVGRYRFRWVSETDGRLPRFLGPTVRGGLGHVLRRMVCVTRLPDCAACLLRYRCAYPVLFQPFAREPTSQGGRYGRMPVPFVLRVPFGRDWRPERRAGDVLEFELVVVGRANLDLPYYVLALLDLGKAGLGPTGHRLRLEAVDAWTVDGFVPLYRGEEAVLRGDPPLLHLNQLLNTSLPGDRGRLGVRFLSPVRLDLRGDLVYPVSLSTWCEPSCSACVRCPRATADPPCPRFPWRKPHRRGRRWTGRGGWTSHGTPHASAPRCGSAVR